MGRQTRRKNYLSINGCPYPTRGMEFGALESCMQWSLIIDPLPGKIIYQGAYGLKYTLLNNRIPLGWLVYLREASIFHLIGHIENDQMEKSNFDSDKTSSQNRGEAAD